MSKLAIKRSNCCNAGIEIKHGEGHSFFSTSWHKCLECKEPCDIHIEWWEVDGIRGEDEEAKDNN